MTLYVKIATDHSTQGMNIHLSSYKRKADSGTESNHDGSILAKDKKNINPKNNVQMGLIK